ncbi:MAG: L-arabinose isomerase [Anaerolineales bacterium]|jgi:L-arabinose isomerase
MLKAVFFLRQEEDEVETFKDLEVWFVTGSQHLYGEQALRQVGEDSQKIVEWLNRSGHLPVKLVFQPVLATAEAVSALCQDANGARQCVGLVTWMHTFSPAKMWIEGLISLRKPWLDLHTQFRRDLPWSTIDMDFMNLNQTAHGGREFGFIAARMRLARKVVVGFWQDKETLARLEAWMRVACAWHDLQGMKVARLGDNMRDVAVTEGDKVEAQIRFGFSVNGYGLGELVRRVREVSDSEIDRLVGEYDAQYVVDRDLRSAGEQRRALREAARIELGLRAFLEEGGFKAFTTTFEDLHGLEQLPGLAVQRLMADGYGFGAEGDWKTAALVRAFKVMSRGLRGGTSFMEDYTYHLRPRSMKVLGAHMLEVCASLAAKKPALQIHPLSIGAKNDPPRLVFNVASGMALNASLIDLGSRFRLLANKVEVVPPDEPLPRLPVARAVWKPLPDLKTAAGGWILGGGAHHTAFSQALTAEHLEDFAEIAGVEFLCIDENTRLPDLKKEIRWNEAYYYLSDGIK